MNNCPDRGGEEVIRWVTTGVYDNDNEKHFFSENNVQCYEYIYNL